MGTEDNSVYYTVQVNKGVELVQPDQFGTNCMPYFYHRIVRSHRESRVKKVCCITLRAAGYRWKWE